jgi:hypothetical protein
VGEQRPAALFAPGFARIFFQGPADGEKVLEDLGSGRRRSGVKPLEAFGSGSIRGNGESSVFSVYEYVIGRPVEADEQPIYLKDVRAFANLRPHRGPDLDERRAEEVISGEADASGRGAPVE